MRNGRMVAAIVSGALLIGLFSILGARANDTSPVTSEAKDITPLETKVLFAIPACHWGHRKPGTLLYDRSPGIWCETVRGLAVSNGHIQVWDSTRLLEFDQEGELVSESDAPNRSSFCPHPHPDSARFGPWTVRLEGRRAGGLNLKLDDERGASVATLWLPKEEYPHPCLLQYYDEQSYVGIFGTEPEEVRSLTLYSISPEGLTPKIKLPARVLFGGTHRQFMCDGTKYYVEYLREQNCYQVVRLRYSLKDLGLPEPPAAAKPLVDYGVQILQLDPLGQPVVLLEGGTLSITTPEGESREVSIVLEKALFRLEVQCATPEPEGTWSGDITRYEVRSTDPSIPYTWAVWSGLSLDEFQLLRDSKQVSYLAARLMPGAIGVLAIPPTSRTATQALIQVFTTGNAAHVVVMPVLGLLDPGPFLGLHDRAEDFRVSVQSVTRDPDGGWTVQVKGPYSEQTFTIVGSEGNWRKE